MIDKSNLDAFVQAAVKRAKLLKSSTHEMPYNIGLVLTHTAGVINATARQTPVDPDNLSEIFKVGEVDIAYAECIDAATKEIQVIHASLTPKAA